MKESHVKVIIVLHDFPHQSYIIREQKFWSFFSLRLHEILWANSPMNLSKEFSVNKQINICKA